MEIYLNYEYHSHRTGQHLGREVELFDSFDEMLTYVGDNEINDINSVHVIAPDARTGLLSHTCLTDGDIRKMLDEKEADYQADLRHARSYAVPR
jgi:hypothetical protein